MFRSSKFLFMICLISVVFLTGCICSVEGIESFLITPDTPIDGSVITSLNPTFTWTNNKTCDPNKYRIRIEENVLSGSFWFDDDIAYRDLPFTLAGPSLLPGRQYTWKVRAETDYVSSESPSAQGAFSETVSFFTGPVCSGETLVAPTLEYPYRATSADLDNWITHDGLQEFHWSYTGGCLPISYDYQFATDIGFTDTVLSGTTTEPYVQSIYETFPNCSTMFWRVRANDGTSTGPWSDGWQFHWVRKGTDCYQTHYISDEAARIDVRLYHDECSYTGEPAGIRLGSTGCKLDKDGVTLVGDGELTYPPDSALWNFRIDLGSGPCPSTGLDQKGDGDHFEFYVLAPGTYCVSVTKDQLVVGGSGSVNLMHGIWTDPRTNDIVAYKEIVLGPGTSDVIVNFGWDEYDHFTVMPELPEGKNCRICPDPIGPVIDIFPEGSFVPIFGRDMNSEWKLSRSMGVPCYLWLENDQINQALMNYEGFDWKAEDLDYFPQPAPCPEPESEPSEKNCSDYKTEDSCKAAGCLWPVGANFCSPK